MHNTNNVPLAFPQPNGPGAGEYGEEGMTLLDYHAGNILAAMVGAQPMNTIPPVPFGTIVDEAYTLARALIARRAFHHQACLDENGAPEEARQAAARHHGVEPHEL